MTIDRIRASRFSKRALIRGAAAGGAALAAGTAFRGPFGLSADARTKVSVLAPLPPDPAPPGAGTFSNDELKAWEKSHKADVSYESVRWPELHDKIAGYLKSGPDVRDVIYMSGWAPEFSGYLVPIGDQIPPDLKADLPPSSFNAVSWSGGVFGVVYTLSILTLFYNKEHLQTSGLTKPPATWDELKGYAKELTKGDQQFGWVSNYAAAEGIGGVTSYWMAFLQQAGGKMYGDDGLPVFNDQAGLDALQLMIDLLPSTDPSSLNNIGINDATNVLKSGKASMMMNWPFMWKDAQDPTTSVLADKLGSAILPAGSAGSASIDGTDAWTISKASKVPDLAMQLLEFYLDPVIQKRQVLDTGWLPIRLSTLADPEVQKAATNAAVVLEQAKYPYNSFITPDYGAVTRALGAELQQALQGGKTAAVALKDASDAVATIVQKRKM